MASPISLSVSTRLSSSVPTLVSPSYERPASPFSTHSRDSSSDSLSLRSGFQGSALERDTELKRIIFTAINDDDRDTLLDLFANYPAPTDVLQLLLTTTYPNADGFYQLDEEVLNDAAELLGPSISQLNAIQIACVLNEEDIALDILEFVARVTEEIESRKVLYEFMGRVWGNGNTVLHLASFQGMSELVKRLLELGAASRKKNERNYMPVDCADDDVTREMFGNNYEVAPPPPPMSVVISNSPPTFSSMENLARTKQAPLDKQVSLPIFAEDKESGRHTKSVSVDEGKSILESIAASSAVISPEEKLASIKSSSSLLGLGKGMAGANVVVVGVDKMTQEALVNISTSASKKSPRTTPRKSSFPRTRPEERNVQKKSVRFDPPTLLLHLCQYGASEDPNYLNSVKSCISHETFDINTLFTPQKGLTPLHQACTHGQTEIVALLLEQTSTLVNTRDTEGWTPLHCACAEGHVDVVRLLGACQGRSEKGGKRKARDVGLVQWMENDEWVFCPPDGPIELIPINNDGEAPEDIVLEEKAGEILQIISDLKERFPPPEEYYESLGDDDDVEIREPNDEIEPEDADENIEEIAAHKTDESCLPNLASISGEVPKPVEQLVPHETDVGNADEISSAPSKVGDALADVPAAVVEGKSESATKDMPITLVSLSERNGIADTRNTERDLDQLKTAVSQPTTPLRISSTQERPPEPTNRLTSPRSSRHGSIDSLPVSMLPVPTFVRRSTSDLSASIPAAKSITSPPSTPNRTSHSELADVAPSLLPRRVSPPSLPPTRATAASVRPLDPDTLNDSIATRTVTSLGSSSKTDIEPCVQPEIPIPSALSSAAARPPPAPPAPHIPLPAPTSHTSITPAAVKSSESLSIVTSIATQASPATLTRMRGHSITSPSPDSSPKKPPPLQIVTSVSLLPTPPSDEPSSTTPTRSRIQRSRRPSVARSEATPIDLKFLQGDGDTSSSGASADTSPMTTPTATYTHSPLTPSPPKPLSHHITSNLVRREGTLSMGRKYGTGRPSTVSTSTSSSASQYIPRATHGNIRSGLSPSMALPPTYAPRPPKPPLQTAHIKTPLASQGRPIRPVITDGEMPVRKGSVREAVAALERERRR
ncbi:uncharacterized protein SPPG_00216 [Spizellomyces punctatus DAOM BR117]|uniref:Ankyrin n=1 Tax=Spizellomyces punctatus (strain DAOM BR117) TaxID=645134 RepID=A0A0L0HTP7_SPIPD|nr:uncharacterized protein SPPG_00216 [Spizellomyces punctatus DAOM BR117]KND04488.1 hypothetical protein SPPG_00216 [Spizellomyces punctatus DAOM BR117]|eukprot:XP_016612527.1 hypothetical protein SPPG_00216 [Spizellomyces punctatus DAOM BR117]